MILVKNITVTLILLITVIFIVPSQAAIEAVEFDNPELLARYQGLIAELRCTVCQNQNLADSNAELAKDLRRKTEEMLKAEYSDKEILAYMRERYGDFVLYRPPLTGSTYLLWLGPFVLLIIATVGILLTIKSKQNTSISDHLDQDINKQHKRNENNQRHKKIRDLLND